MKKKILIGLGFISFGLGVIGIFLPLLPTTPLMLLAATLFAKSSEKFYSWLLYHPRFGKYVYQYKIEKVIPVKIKIYALSSMWTLMLISAFVILKKLPLQILLMTIATCVTIYILSFKSKKEEEIPVKIENNCEEE